MFSAIKHFTSGGELYRSTLIAVALLRFFLRLPWSVSSLSSIAINLFGYRTVVSI
jgi:hypothetical protein